MFVLPGTTCVEDVHPILYYYFWTSKYADKVKNYTAEVLYSSVNMDKSEAKTKDTQITLKQSLLKEKMCESKKECSILFM